MTLHQTMMCVRPWRAAQRGMTLIELMVAVVISMVLSLAIFAVLAGAEGSKRTTTSVNDINQAGNYAMYSIDKWVRSAGSGLTQKASLADSGSIQNASYLFGCQVFAAKSGTTVLPSTPPAPFNSVNTTGTAGQFRLAPVLIAPGQTTPGVSGSPSDVLVVMSGSAGFGETPADFSSAPLSNKLTLSNTVSFRPNDIVLVANKQGAAGTLSPCMVQQVSTAAVSGKDLNLAGTYANGTIGSASLASMPLEGAAINLGNIAGDNPPVFLLIGVGDNNTLFSYDLLQATANPLLPVADGVFEMHALYGVDNNNDGTVDAWVDPSASGSSYALARLMTGDQTAVRLLQSIKAIRVGLITRTSLPEKTTVAPATLTLFSDVAGASFTRTLTTAERSYRYRTIESTIPVRNSMF